jgi:hypothetical protein
MAPLVPYLDLLHQAFVDELVKEPPLINLSIKEFRATFEKIQEHKSTPSVTRIGFNISFEIASRHLSSNPRTLQEGLFSPLSFTPQGAHG